MEKYENLESLSKEELVRIILDYKEKEEKIALYEAFIKAIGIDEAQIQKLLRKLNDVENNIRHKFVSASETVLSLHIEEARFDTVDKFFEQEVHSEIGDSYYVMNLTDKIGKNQWEKLSYSSKQNLITAAMLKKQSFLPDKPSLICISFSKPVEREMRQRIFKSYKEFLEEKYGKDNICLWPTGMRSKKNANKSCNENDFSLGSVSFVVGMKLQSDFNEFQEFAKNKCNIAPNLICDFSNYLVFFSGKLIPYRNPAAHGSEDYVSLNMANECEQIVLGKNGLARFLNYFN